MKQSISNLKLAERGAIISISTYLILSAAKLAAGHLLHSSSLVADGFNNVSDIIGNVALLIGIRMAPSLQTVTTVLVIGRLKIWQA
ncbi:cation efflux family protein [Streptococcus pneumoniae]|nr:cation efflux family protein [Streptococcus pneumoniae]